MASDSKPRLSPLPWTEVLVYWVLSFGSHLYSFYKLHTFSKEHEEGLEREFKLENGLLKGFKRDILDFEWSFWTEWAKNSLLWTLIGHGIISRLTTIFNPKLRVPALTLYGFLAASSVLGIKGVSVLLVHLGVSFSVAQLRKPTLSWLFNLLLISTLHIKSLQDIQRGWYSTEEEYYLLLFSVAMCGLRFISFSLEHCWSPLDPSGVVELFWLFSYTFYHPLFYNGPIITFKAYTEQMRWSIEERSNRSEPALRFLLLRSGRILLWWCLAEYMIHVMYMHSIQSIETYIEILPPWALGGLALALVQFFYVKYLVLFGLPCTLAALDELVPPKLPSCVSIMYSFTGMWRHFDEGLYRWLIRWSERGGTDEVLGFHGRVEDPEEMSWSTIAPPMLAFLYCFAQIGLEWTSHPP
ncbi:protein-cysteine N-palmitoyltransferase HHAT [Nematolebias whitei]|uniref:protein-cysteine N-palmitoyltransferase HHAT n=1 Tax=Nematolebias whitei TaxID=451745 RepID=UPI001899EA05|nr:protein-cysteine N-palmitoyltransferase HHAT [Nematolebias whitei]